MTKIKAVAVFAAFAAAASAVAQTTDQSTGVEVFSNVKEVAYAKTVQGGTITPDKAWEGTRIFKKNDGTCVQVEHTELKILKSGDAQRAEFKETKIPVACPK